MSLKTNYVVTLRGSLPADLSERLAVAQAQAIRNRRYRDPKGGTEQGKARYSNK